MSNNNIVVVAGQNADGDYQILPLIKAPTTGGEDQTLVPVSIGNFSLPADSPLPVRGVQGADSDAVKVCTTDNTQLNAGSVVKCEIENLITSYNVQESNNKVNLPVPPDGAIAPGTYSNPYTNFHHNSLLMVCDITAFDPGATLVCNIYMVGGSNTNHLIGTLTPAMAVGVTHFTLSANMPTTANVSQRFPLPPFYLIEWVVAGGTVTFSLSANEMNL